MYGRLVWPGFLTAEQPSSRTAKAHVVTAWCRRPSFDLMVGSWESRLTNRASVRRRDENWLRERRAVGEYAPLPGQREGIGRVGRIVNSYLSTCLVD
jgi:hypothetical protein